jgi:hypothetical protein
VSYENKTIDLVLVSVNGSTTPNGSYIRQVLDTIYTPAFVNWTVDNMSLTLDIADSFGVVNTTKTWIDNVNTSDHMSFNYQEKQVRKAMKKLDAYDSDKYYLFFFDTGKRTDLKGYMVFKSHFGFIFKFSQDPDELARTIGHEIAHGAFRLRHTFSDKNKYVQAPGSTTNLMDYVDAAPAQSCRRLLKYQWDFIHDPESITVSDEETEEAANSDYIPLVWTDFKEAAINFTFLAPSGYPFTAKGTITACLYQVQLYNSPKRV